MIRIMRWLVWLLVSLVVVSLLDQALTRVPLKVPVLEQFQSFYVDFRGRLFSIAGKSRSVPSVEKVIEATKKPAPVADKAAAPQYLYVDKTGSLQFADSLDAVPRAYRQDAQRMDP